MKIYPKAMPSAKKPKLAHDGGWSTKGLGAHAAELDIAKLTKEPAGKRLEPGSHIVMQQADNKQMTVGGESLEYELPELCQRGVLSMVILEHRKAEENKKDMESVVYKDPSKKGAFDDAKGSYTRVEMRFTGTDSWHTYLSFGHPQKFAEPRSRQMPEVEGLHDWPAQQCGPRAFDRIKLTSVGLSAVHVHKLRVHCYPPEAVKGEPRTVVLIQHTAFGDYVPQLVAGGRERGCQHSPLVTCISEARHTHASIHSPLVTCVSGARHTHASTDIQLPVAPIARCRPSPQVR